MTSIPSKFSVDTSEAYKEPSGTPQPSGSDAESSSPSSPSPAPGAEAGESAPFLQGDEFASLREKFKTPEDLARSYLAAEKKISGAPSADLGKNLQVPEKPPAGAQDISPEAFQAFSQEYAEKGSLSPESYQKLEQEYHIPKAVADSYIAGQQALAKQQLTDVLGSAGISSVDEYQKLSGWAQANLPPAELETYNRMVAGTDLGATKMAVAHLAQRYQAANGKAPTLVGGKPIPGSVEQPFESNAQVIEAMKDKRYKTDEAYRAKVERRLAVSNVLNHGRLK